MKQSCCHLRSAPMVSFPRRMSGLRRCWPGESRESCKWLREEDHSFSTGTSCQSSPLGQREIGRCFSSHHFCAIARHLSCASTASDGTWGAGHGGGSLDLSI